MSKNAPSDAGVLPGTRGELPMQGPQVSDRLRTLAGFRGLVPLSARGPARRIGGNLEVSMKISRLLAAALLFAICSCSQADRPPDLRGGRIVAGGVEVSLEITASPFGVSVSGPARVEELGPGVTRIVADSGDVAVGLEHNEAIYGLTERIVDSRLKSELWPAEVGGLDRRGERVTMWVKPTIAAYVPFYVSSRGYGLLVEGTRPGWFDIGKADPDTLRIGWDRGGEELSIVVFHGPSYYEVLDRYTEHAGRPFLPPRWVFLPWKWRGECKSGKFAEVGGLTINAEVADDILMYEKLGLPAGVYLIDRPWARGTMGYGNFEWDQDRFPNGDAMVKMLKDRGWRVIIWGAPWALGDEPREFGPEARAKGLIVGDRNLDYTNPEAVRWHMEKIEEFLRRSDADGWKLDRADEYVPSRKSVTFHDGRSGFAVHNDYPRMYIKTYHDATRNVRGNDFVLMVRPGYTGTQAWSIVWGGDTYARVYLLGVPFGTDKGLRSAIISLQRMAFMGYPVWGSDTGGYHQFMDREVFARWLQFSCFCPMMEIGGVDSREPWNMPTDPAYDKEMIAIYRKYTRLHANLADYSWSLAKEASKTGEPIVRPLIMEWPGDPGLLDMWDEYLYGPALLVAPVWETGARERKVYLPEGEWESLWDRSKKYAGPVTITVRAELDSIPVFVRTEKAGMLPGGLLDNLE